MIRLAVIAGAGPVGGWLLLRAIGAWGKGRRGSGVAWACLAVGWQVGGWIGAGAVVGRFL